MANYLYSNCLSGTTCLLQKYKINQFKVGGISLVTTYTGNVNGNDILTIDNYLYTVILSANTISKFDLNLNLIKTISVTSGTTYMCEDGTYIYACTNTKTYKFDNDLNFQTSATTVNWKYGLCTGGYLYVLSNYTIYKYDTATLSLIDSVAYGTSSYTAMALTTDNTYLYVGGKSNSGYNGLLNKYDLATLTKITGITMSDYIIKDTCLHYYDGMLYTYSYRSDNYRLRIFYASNLSFYDEKGSEGNSTGHITAFSQPYLYSNSEADKLMAFSLKRRTGGEIMSNFHTVYALKHVEITPPDGYVITASGAYVAKTGTDDLYKVKEYDYGYGWAVNLCAKDVNYAYFIAYPYRRLSKLNPIDLSVVQTATVGQYTGGFNFDANIIINGDYIYAATSNFSSNYTIINKYKKSDLSYVASGTCNIEFAPHGMAIYGDYLYAAGYHSNYLYKYNKYTLNLVNAYAVASCGDNIQSIIADNGYIYFSDYGHVLRKFNIATSSVVDSLSFPTAWDAGSCLTQDSNYIYVIYDYTFTHYGYALLKINKTTFSIVTSAYYPTSEQTALGSNISYSYNDNYLYIAQANGRIAAKHNRSDLSLVTDTYTVINNNIQKFALIQESLYLLPPAFCTALPFTISGSTCGNADGKISIITPAGDYVQYSDIYDFTLTDVWGNSYILTIDDTFTGLTSNYYFLTATVKPEYWYYYGRETCTFEWLKVEDSDTTMANTGVSVRNTICGGFGKQQGRIAYICTDSGANPVYTAKLYNKETHDLVQTVTGNTIDLIIFVPLSAADYYCHITNSAGCSLLIGSTRVEGESLRSVAGIKKLWLTRWDASVEYDYWAQSDEDYYLASVDADFFNSIKIKRFIDSTLPDIWYSVNVQTKGITFQQKMNKTKQGFVFTDTLTLTIPEADNTKWKELVDILQHQYILIFLDNNGDYWCMGYRHGANVDGYKRENNEYILEFNAISENKILTNIDKQYVIDSIL